MNFLKLNIRRFEDVEIANLVTTVSINDQTGNSKNVINNMDKMGDSISRTVAKIEQLESATTRGRSKQTKLSNSAALEQFGRLKEQLATTQNLSISPSVSDKFLADAETKLSKLRILMDSVTANKYTKGNLNQFATLAGSFAKMNIAENAKQMKNFGGATQQAGVYAAKFSNGMDKASNSSSKFTEMMKKLAGAAVRWRILYGAFSRVWNILSDTVDKAAAYEEALNLYTVALGEYADEASEWANKISSALYLDPKYIMQYTGALYNLVQGLGVSSDAAYIMSTNLTQLAYDMSSYLNIDVQSAYDKLQSAMTGQSRAVASAGIAMQQASLQELAYSMGINKLVTDMTQAEKTYLRYIQIMRSTVNMQGDLGRTLVTPENAIRVLKQQFELLGRAIGSVFIPIVMTAIPYVMALTQVLTDLAKKLASALGYELADIDYSSLTTADTAVEDTFNNMSKSASGASKSIKGSINRTLAAFDELNVVESESAGASGGRVGGGIPSSTLLGDLEPYITGYDMLAGLNDKLSDKVEKAKKNLKVFGDILAKVLGVFLAIKGLKAVDSLIRFVQGLKKARDAGIGLPGLLKNVMTYLKPVFSALGTGIKTLFQGKLGIEAVHLRLEQLLGKAGTVAGGITSLAMSFITAASATRHFGDEGTTATGSFLKLAGGVTAASLAAGAFLGPVGLVAGAVVGLAGAIYGTVKNAEDLKRQLEQKIAYEKLFDGIGVSTQTVIDSFNNVTGSIMDYQNKLEESKEKLEESKTSVENSAKSWQDLHEAINLGINDDKTIDKLKQANENYKVSVDNNKAAQIQYHDTVLQNLTKQGIITKEKYQEMSKDISGYYTKQALYQSEYSDQLTDLDIKLASGKITQQEYDAEVEKLGRAYAGIIDPMDSVSDGFSNLYAQAAKKINLENPQKVYDLVAELGKSYDETKQKIEDNKKAYEEYVDSEITQTQRRIDTINKKIQEGDLTPEQVKKNKKAVEEYEKHISTLQTERQKAMEGFKTDTETLEATYKNYMLTIMAQISQAGADSGTELETLFDGMWRDIRKLEDVDTKKSGYDLLKNYFDGIKDANGKLSPATAAMFERMGVTFDEALLGELITGFEKGTPEYEAALNKMIKNPISGVYTLLKEAGKNSSATYTKEYIDGLNSKKEDVKNATQGVVNATAEEAGVSPTPSSSPSVSTKRGFGAIGGNSAFAFVSTLAQGIFSKKGDVKTAISDLTKDGQAELNKNPFKLNFENNKVASSFNSILKTLKSFSNKWGDGISDILNNTKSSFGGLSFKDGKLSFNPFKLINIKFFAEGGYPTSGDLFFANENGNAEYITSLGNRTAVANQDQMVSALTNAIIQGMSNLETNRQPGITQVYIGNEKIYEGQGQYQNRQAERYGTAVIKI